MSYDENKLRNWTTEECEELVRFFFERREILIEELRRRKITKDLNDIVGKLFADDFKPSADQVQRKIRDILKSDTKETKAGLLQIPPALEKDAFFNLFMYLNIVHLFCVLFYYSNMSFL